MTQRQEPTEVKARATLTIAFTDDGEEVSFPIGDPVHLADGLSAVLRSFEANPDRICCAAGLHDPGDHRPGACR